MELTEYIIDLLVDFDEMGFAPTTLCLDPEAYAIEWRKKLTEELKGYRKASEVAREIFEEIEKIAMHGTTPFGLCLMSMGEASFAKLKKKYTEDGE